ncbi:MAG: HAMP domain-containing histidine kinase [Chloroflexi bacterium]|nr:HAMP domain-containing histidine kinase [Chloroflexota bacterium]
MSLPTKQDFATEVRADRLTVLWQVTLYGSLVVFWIIITIATLRHQDALAWLLAMAAVSVGCLMTRFFLRRDRYQRAVWSYTLGGLTGGAILLAWGDDRAIQMIPFIFPVIVFVVGLLLSPRNTLLTAILAAAIVFFLPGLSQEGMLLHIELRLFAIGLIVASALLAAQVTGELYQVTEWALLNYQRERRTTEALHENRMLLEKALKRSQALSEELQETNEELESARAAAEEAKYFRGQFLANMSHELRTPLNAIIGFSETMLKFPAMYDDVPLPKGYESDLHYIFDSGRQLLNLINDILDLSKVDAGKLDMQIERVEPLPIIEAVLSISAGLLGEKPVELRRDFPAVMPSIQADPNRLRQVLMNLYSNAVKFTDTGSITLIVREAGEAVQFSVKDTGSGIDPKNHNLIFEEFKQAEVVGRDPRAGAGLGLAISRQLLTLMGGRIWVESEVGKGATFHFTVPASPPPALQPTALLASPAAVPDTQSAPS